MGTLLAAHPQKAMLKTAAFEVIVELPLDIARQYRTMSRKMGGKYRVMLFDNRVEKYLFGLVPLVTVST